jgi:hypothetical protein
MGTTFSAWAVVVGKITIISHLKGAPPPLPPRANAIKCHHFPAPAWGVLLALTQKAASSGRQNVEKC